MKTLNKTENAIKGTAWGIANRFVTIAFPFFIRTIIIYTLGAEYTGLSSLFTSILQVLSLSELGFSTAMVYAMYEPIAQEDYAKLSALLNYYKKIYIYIGCIILIFGLTTLPFIRLIIHGETPDNVNIYILFVIYLINTTVSYFVFAYRASLLNAYQRDSVNSKIHFFVNLLTYITQMLFLLFIRNYYIYVMLIPISTLMYNYIRFISAKREYPNIKCEGQITFEQHTAIKKSISALIFHKIGNVTVNAIDNIAISSFGGLLLLSYYNNYYYIISSLTSVILILFSSLTAGIGNSLITITNTKNRETFYEIFFINGFIVSLCTTCLFSIYQDFIVIWVGTKYLFSLSSMVLFCIYFFVHTIRRTIITYRDAAGLWSDNKWQPIISAFINLSLNILLIKTIGINGIIIATVISMIFVDIPWESITFTKRLFNDAPIEYFKRMFRYLIITIIGCIIVKIVDQYVPITNVLIHLIISFFIAFVVSIFLFFYGTMYTHESINTRRKIKKLLNDKIRHLSQQKET